MKKSAIAFLFLLVASVSFSAGSTVAEELRVDSVGPPPEFEIIDTQCGGEGKGCVVVSGD